MRVFGLSLPVLSGRAAPRRDRGLTLIESSAVLALLTIMVLYLGSMLSDSYERMRDKAAADRLTEVHEASTAYIKANFARLSAAAPAAPNALVVPITGTAGPAGAPGTTSLQNAGFLPPSFVNKNSYEQSHTLLVRKLGSDGLEGLVTTVGGRVIPDDQLGRIASLRGAAGGFMQSSPVNPADAGFVTGAFGGWRSQASTWGSVNRPSSGHLASTLAFDEGGLISDYLYRNDVGIPEANRMNTAIDLNSNDLNNVRTIGAQTANVTTGNVTTVNSTTGNIRQVNADNVVAELDIWSKRDIRSSGDMRSARDVLASRNVSAGNEVSAGSRVSSNGTIYARGAISSDNTVYAGLDVTAGRNVSAENVIARLDLWASRNVNASQDVTASRNVVAGAHSYGQSFRDTNDGNYYVDPNGVARLNNVQANTMDANVQIYGAGVPTQSLGQAVSKLWGCRLQYRFMRNTGGNWVDGPYLNGTTNTGQESGWAVGGLNDECNGPGCRIQMRIQC